MDEKNIIAQRIALELKTGELVDLGIGIPMLVADYIDQERNITFFSENGIVGLGKLSVDNNTNLVNVDDQKANLVPGGSFVDSSLAFAMIRGGHLDVAVLGALEVDQEGNLASWIVPGEKISGMGGAMDLAVGASKIIVAMTHTEKGKPKIRKKCSLPLTAIRPVSMIVTEMAVISVEEDGLFLREINPDYTIEEVLNATEAKLHIDEVIPMKGVIK